jgi:hypothetical protein
MNQFLLEMTKNTHQYETFYFRVCEDELEEYLDTENILNNYIKLFGRKIILKEKEFCIYKNKTENIIEGESIIIYCKRKKLGF